MSSSLSETMHQILDRFDEAWKGPSPPRIDDFLLPPDSPGHLPMLIDLLKMDMERRLNCGEQPALEEYCQRFPACATVVAGCLDEARVAAQRAASGGNESVAFPDLSTLDGPPILPPIGLPPRRLGEYEVLERLASGGMGEVYKARHRQLDKLVALKLLLANSENSHEVAARFRREIKAIGALDHPNIVEAYDAGEQGGIVYLAMKLIDGVDLQRLVKERGPLPIPEACELVRQTLRGLHYLHQRGLIHRDVKPSNLMQTTDGTVKVLDLGLARWCVATEERSLLTGRRQVMGTPDYLAPEQIESESNVDGRADLYGLGGTLFYLLTRRAPFAHHQSLYAKLMAHCSEPLPDVQSLRPDVSIELAALVQRLLAKKPEERYRTAAEAAAALELFMDSARQQRLLLPQRERSLSAVPAVAETLPALNESAKPITSPSAEPTLPSCPRILRFGNPDRSSGRRWLLIFGLMGLLLGSGGVWLWSKHRPAEREHADAVSNEKPIEVGILFSQRGPMANDGIASHEAADLAIAELNEQGGLLGWRIVAVHKDGASNYRRFKEEAEKLITEDRVCVIFGTRASVNRKAVKEIVEKYDHLLFYPMQFEGLELSPNVIYLGAAPNQQMFPALDYMLGEKGKRRLFLIGSDSVYPHAANEILRDYLKARFPDAQIINETYLAHGETDVKETVEAIRKAKPDLIVNTINGDTNVAFFRALYRAGIRADSTPVLSFSLGKNDLLNIGEAGVGHFAAWSYFQKLDREKSREFVRKFQKMANSRRVISDPMEAVYFGVHLWAKAVEAAGSAEPRAVRDAIGGLEMEAPEGKVRIDRKTHYTWRIMRIVRIGKEGHFEPAVETADEPIPPEPFPPTSPRTKWEPFLNKLYEGWGNNWQGRGE